MRLLILAALLFRTLGLAAQQKFDPPPPPPSSDAFVQDMLHKNLDGVLALYTPDAVFIQPDGSKLTGRPALKALYEKVFATYDSRIELKSGRFSGKRKSPPWFSPGDTETQTGTYTETLTTRSSGQVMHIAGTYIFVYRLQANETWLIQAMRWTLNK